MLGHLGRCLNILEHHAAIFCYLQLPGEKKAVTMSKPAKLPSTSAQGAAGFARAEDGAATSEAPGRAQFSSFSMEELPQMDLKLGQKKILKGE